MNDMKPTDKVGKITLDELFTFINHIVDARLAEYDRRQTTEDLPCVENDDVEIEDIKERLRALEFHIEDGNVSVEVQDSMIEALKRRGFFDYP